MKGLVLRQPYASLVTAGLKRIETRPWKGPVGETIAICAAAAIDAEAMALYSNPFIGGMPHAEWSMVWKEVGFPTGVVMATVNIGAVLPAENFWIGHDDQLCMCDFSEGRYGWVLEDLRVLAEPVPVKGQQRLFELPREVNNEVLRQHLAAA